MYTEQDFIKQKKHCDTLTLTCFIPAAVLFVVIFLLFLIPRIPSALTIVFTILLFGGVIFYYDYFIQPQKKYLKHLDHALHGKTRTLNAYFESMEEGADKREGVYYYPLMVYTDPDNIEDSQRLLYYDANLPRPDWQENQAIQFVIYDKFICAWQA